ncbi:hypothetical protein CRE_25912 [Caenorhabditis remanei]|uniref:Uncharacterized protein n=1 Tax=Caenorhabditis remanei TaxID=31234 RepID=E3NI48_CAERE|nr:hypothetical protein CRE_25912 [Caenorhabditis remanei]
MQADFNLPFRQQAVTRTHHQLHQNYQSLPRHQRPKHGYHVFCRECFERNFLRSSIFKVYILIAWCIGLAALMYIQKPEGQEFKMSNETRVLYTAISIIYLFSQITGLLAVVTEFERIFIPYGIVLVITIIVNIIFMSIALVDVSFHWFNSKKDVNLEAYSKKIFGDYVRIFLVLSCFFFVYNGLCLASMIHLCSHFEKKRILTERRQREEAARRARIYNRLVELNNRDQPITVNLDSPPKYSNLSTKSETVCTPPPGYSQLKNLEMEEENSEKKSHRALFQNYEKQ